MLSNGSLQMTLSKKFVHVRETYRETESQLIRDTLRETAQQPSFGCMVMSSSDSHVRSQQHVKLSVFLM